MKLRAAPKRQVEKSLLEKASLRISQNVKNEAREIAIIYEFVQPYSLDPCEFGIKRSFLAFG